MDPTVAFVLGLLLGLAVGVLAVVAVLRSVGRITGTDRGGVLRLLRDGLRPGRHRDGVAVQRALARRLKRTGRSTAAGRRVAAAELHVHLSPEDHDRIGESLGVAEASRDLEEFYAAHARRSGWVLHGRPHLELVRDISLRPRQSFVRTVTRASEEARPPVATGPRTGQVPAQEAWRPQEAATDVLPRGLVADDGATDVLPRDLLDDEAGPNRTSVYPFGFSEVGLGDLVVVHGTDVRTVASSPGVLRIGRGPHNDVVIDSPGVARDHVVVEARDDAWWIVPGTSENGTLLDGRSLRGPAVLDGQGLLELGRGVRVRLAVEGR